MLPSIVIQPTVAHSATVIFLHGLGDSGHGWAPVMRMLSRSLPFIKFILPHAPQVSVTLNSGMRMPAWYDIFSLDEKDEREDEAGLMQSKKVIEELIEYELKNGIGEDRIVLGGFSQGGAMSLLTGLTITHKLGGIISLSGYLPLHRSFNSLMNPSTKSLPIFMGHGTADYVVQYRWGKDSHGWLKEAGCTNTTFKSYENLDHSCNDLEIHDVKEFLQACLAEATSKDSL